MKYTGLLKKLLLTVLIISGTLQVKAQSSYQLKLLGQVEIPYNYSFEDTPVGGLSGLTYDRSADMFYVICDDRANLSPARFYSFQLELSDKNQLAEGSIRWKSVHFLKSRKGKKYARGTIDPEGIAVGPNGLVYVSSEGDAAHHVAPLLVLFRKMGILSKSYPSQNHFGLNRKLILVSVTTWLLKDYRLVLMVRCFTLPWKMHLPKMGP